MSTMNVDVVGVSLERVELRLHAPTLKLEVEKHSGEIRIEMLRADMTWLAEALTEDNFPCCGLPTSARNRVEALKNAAAVAESEAAEAKKKYEQFKASSDTAVGHMARRIAELEAALAAVTSLPKKAPSGG